MSYNNFHSSNGLGVPGSGFASRRGNGPNIKRLSFEPTKQTGPLDSGAPTPRTSRSHLLAGLRTAPKSARSSDFPSTAPPTTLQHPTGLGGNAYIDNDTYGGPKTSTFAAQNAYNQMNRHMYSVPEQILAPPEILIDEHGQDQMDPNLYAHLVATNLYLADQQQRPAAATPQRASCGPAIPGYEPGNGPGSTVCYPTCHTSKHVPAAPGQEQHAADHQPSAWCSAWGVLVLQSDHRTAELLHGQQCTAVPVHEPAGCTAVVQLLATTAARHTAIPGLPASSVGCALLFQERQPPEEGSIPTTGPRSTSTTFRKCIPSWASQDELYGSRVRQRNS